MNTTKLCTLLLATVFAPALSAQTSEGGSCCTSSGMFTTSGSGCGVSTEIPAMNLSVDNTPTIGQTTTVTCQGVPVPRDAAVLMLGSAPNQSVDLTIIGMPNCTLYVNNIFHNDPMMIVGSDATVSYPFPNDPASVGASITMQAAVLDLSATINAFGLILSDLGELTLGDCVE